MLDVIFSEINECRKCRLCKTRTNAVPGEGPEDAEILFLGEAPGKIEDETGRPFIGRAGQLLSKCLSEAGIDRKKVFITSVLKCRPPGNRNPKPDELETCLPYVKKQIEVINPKVVCLMGNFACRQIIGKTGVMKLRGNPVTSDRIYLPTFHPAAVLRFPWKYRKEFISDLVKIKKMVKK